MSKRIGSLDEYINEHKLVEGGVYGSFKSADEMQKNSYNTVGIIFQITRKTCN